MKGVAGAITFGAAMMIVAMTPSLWQRLSDAIRDFSEEIQGVPPSLRPVDYPAAQREPLLALLGAAFVLLGIWAYLSA